MLIFIIFGFGIFLFLINLFLEIVLIVIDFLVDILCVLFVVIGEGLNEIFLEELDNLYFSGIIVFGVWFEFFVR